MDMEPEAQQAWDIIEKTRANLFLTGKAGTGKTTFLRELKRRSPKRMVVLAPTGIAAINAGGVTIHSFFQLPLSPYLPGTTFGGREQRRYQFSKQKRNIIRTMDLLVIDEISMVRGDLLDAVDSVMRRYRKHHLPFGGVQLLMIGDMQQLAPVVTPEDEALLGKYYPTPYFFSSHALASAGYLTVELTKVYRQQDTHFVDLLNQIRENKATQATLDELNQRYIPGFQPQADEGYIRLTTHNLPAQRINDDQLAALPTRSYQFQAEVDGTFPETSYPADYQLTLKEGAQVMFIKNDPSHRFYNGMIGSVECIDSEKVGVRSKDTGELIMLEPMEWTNAKYTLNELTKEIEEKVEGTFRQYPLRLAWAITIHKSQGLTFEHAIIDASRSFSHGQTYVALSRCKSLEGMVLSQPLSPQAIISDQVIDQFTDSVSAPTAEQLSALELDCTIATIDELFSFQEIGESYSQLQRTLTEFFSHRHPRLVEAYRNGFTVLSQLSELSMKFRAQYSRLLAADTNVLNEALQERIHKGAGYYLTQMKPLLALIPATQVETENKVARQQVDERLATLKVELMLKQRLLFEAQTAVFTVPDYHKRKAHLLLSIIDPEAAAKAQRKMERERKRTEKKAKAEKEPKIPSREVTIALYEQGKDVPAIAKERGLTTTTIISHLVCYMASGRVNRHKFVSPEHEKAIADYLKAHPDVTLLQQIKADLGGTYTFEEIFIVNYLYRRQQGEH